MNQYMTNHDFRLGYAHFELLNGSLSLGDLTIIQKAHPSPPITHLTEAHISVQWLSLLRGQIIANCVIIGPAIHLNAPQLRTEIATVNLSDLRKALLQMPNFRVNHVQVLDLNFAYADPSRSIDIEHLELSARDLRRTELHSEGSPHLAAAITVEPAAVGSNPAVPRERRAAKGMPQLSLTLAQAHMTANAIVYRDLAPNKGYRLYFKGLQVEVSNISNQSSAVPARFELAGQFMQGGRTTLGSLCIAVIPRLWIS